MYVVEFAADKIPGVDSTWDTLHTFVRIPAGAMLAMSTVGDATPALELSPAIMGGGLAATSHATKAGTRLAVNASPEPFTNWGLSITEDIAVVAGLWAALAHPWIFVGLMVVFLALAIWLLPKIWWAVKFMFRKIGEMLGLVDKSSAPDLSLGKAYVSSPGPVSRGVDFKVIPALETDGSAADSPVDEIARLKKLLDEGAVSTEEFELLKKRVLES